MQHECDKVAGYCCWMERLEESGIGERSLLQLVIPGTHDSATCNISLDKDYASNAPPLLIKAKGIYDGKKLKDLVCRWAIAQERTISQQLEDGIRYLDLRVCFIKKSADEVGELLTCHSVISDNMNDVLADIKAFAQLHPKEVIIVDFNHFYDLDESAHVQLVQILVEFFDGMMIPSELSLRKTKLKQIWESGCNILVLYDKKKVVREHSFLWSQNSIKSAWMNVADVGLLRSKLDAHLKFRKRVLDKEATDPKRQYRKILHVTQGLVTPDTKMIAKSALGIKYKSLTALGKAVTPAVIDWMTTDWKDLDLNIVIVDHYHYTNFIEIIFQQNINNLLRQEQ